VKRIQRPLRLGVTWEESRCSPKMVKKGGPQATWSVSATRPRETMAELAREYDCSEPTIWRVLRGRKRSKRRRVRRKNKT